MLFSILYYNNTLIFTYILEPDKDIPLYIVIYILIISCFNYFRIPHASLCYSYIKYKLTCSYDICTRKGGVISYILLRYIRDVKTRMSEVNSALSSSSASAY
jgi:hypothetical protein